MIAAMAFAGSSDMPTIKIEGNARQVLSLDGMWQIAEGSMEETPRRFGHSVPVPGLADMAEPKFQGVGVKNRDTRREAFWYRRSFKIDGAVPAVARLKIHKAKYGTRVVLNGKHVGDHLPNFTPVTFDVRDYLKGQGQDNELLIRVGSSRESNPKTIPDGWDFEKDVYIPGIYDSVELIFSGAHHIVRVQTVPEIDQKTVRVVATLYNAGSPAQANVSFRVLEEATGKVVGTATAQGVSLKSHGEVQAQIRIPIQGCRLWSPADPFLYRLEANTETDTLSVRFGMRSFGMDPKTKMPVLNGKPYPLRGTNVTIFRFFEDPQRGNLPWRSDWVRRLHRIYRGMNWDSLRYCIGFPPDFWYDIADEEGILVQDEFPIWYMNNWPKELRKEQLVQEYTEWMQERWNHPSVVIWDAQNETSSQETGPAIQAVRGLDLSDRVWDNGWMPPARETDLYEAHPYPLIDGSTFHMPDFEHTLKAPAVRGGIPGSPRLNDSNNPVIINEYDWMWLNRDGSPTTLTKKNYERLAPNSGPEERFKLNARIVASMTEFWRTGRKVAGIHYFVGLTSSQPGAKTCDPFLDIKNLVMEPHFEKYVRDAFAPVGLMVDHWAEERLVGESFQVPVVAINDLSSAWQGNIRFRMIYQGKTVFEKVQACRMDPMGQVTLHFDLKAPQETGEYLFVADLAGVDGKPVQSTRNFNILTPKQRQEKDGIAKGAKVQSSSSKKTNVPKFAVDGRPRSHWASEPGDLQWIAVDLGTVQTISRVELSWERAFASSYAIEVSRNGQDWQDVFQKTSGNGGKDICNFDPVETRWVRMSGIKQATAYGYSLWEFKVFP